jgi:hypothetical protein
VTAGTTKQGVLQEIFNLATEKLTREEVNKMFLATDNEGMTVFHVAAVWSKQEVLKEIFNLAKENLTTEEKTDFFLPQIVREGRSFIW